MEGIVQSADKIHYLKRYLGDKIKGMIECSAYINDESAYDRACEIRDKRYGNNFLVSEAIRNKLYKWPAIGEHDSHGLRAFADYLQQCNMSLPYLSGLSILHDFRENRKLVSKLPNWMIQRWKRIAAKDTTSYPTFSQFTLFVTKEADIQCNPVPNDFGRGDNQKTNFMKHDKHPPRGHSFITETVPPDNKSEPCQYCKKARHVLLNCRSFMSKTSAERREFIIKNGICFGCLRKGHKARFCPNRLTCTKCDGRHPTCLCGDLNDWKRKKSQTPEGPTCIEHAIDAYQQKRVSS